jgi:cobalt/nickel transport system permease protein
MNHARVWLLAYVLAVVAITFVHQPAWLALGLGAALLAAGGGRWRLLRRAVVALLLFNVSVSLTYALLAWWQTQPVLMPLVLINLRVLLLVFLGFWLVERVRLLDALRGWPVLSMVASLTLGQIVVYRRLLEDFRCAFRSRNPLPPTPVTLLRQAGVQGGALLEKSLHGAEQAAQAMRSRGSFDG